MPLGNKQGGRKMRLKGFFALALTAALSCTALAYKPALAEDTGLDQVGRGDYLGGVKGKKVIFIPIAMGSTSPSPGRRSGASRRPRSAIPSRSATRTGARMPGERRGAPRLPERRA